MTLHLTQDLFDVQNNQVLPHIYQHNFAHYFLNNNPSSDIYTAYCQYLIDKYGLSVKDPRELSNIRKNISNEVFSTEIGFKPDVSKLILKLKDLGYSVIDLGAYSTVTLEKE